MGKPSENVGKSCNFPEDNIYSILSYSRIKKKTVYLVECSVCSVDEDLWPRGSITISGGNLKERLSTCGCKIPVRWTKQQYEILVIREAERAYYNYLGIVGEYKGKKTKIAVQCKVDGTVCKTNIDSFLSRNNKVKTCSISDSSLLSHIDFILNLGKIPRGTLFCRGKNSEYLKYKCFNCSSDAYVKMGLCDGVFEANLQFLKGGGLSCRCSSQYIWDTKQREYQLTQLLSADGARFVRWETEYVDSFSKPVWECKHGILNKTNTVNDLLNGRRCSCETVHGYDPTKRGHFYLVRWKGADKTYLKVGVTNRNIVDRLTEQDNKTALEYEVLYTFSSETGEIPLILEKVVKDSFNKNSELRLIFPDGWSEMFEDTVENLKVVTTLLDDLKVWEISHPDDVKIERR